MLIINNWGTLTWFAIERYNLTALQKEKIILTISFEYFFFKVFGINGMIDFGEELVK